MIRVSIVGSTGYTGGELLRLLVRHPDVEIQHLTSENSIGKPIQDIHPFLKGFLNVVCEKYDAAKIAKDSDVVFLGLPHGAAAKTGAELVQKGTRVIDLSADFRLKHLPTFKHWYGEHPVPALTKQAVYGLPERYRKSIRKATLVANPGCYATTSILAGLPLMHHQLIKPKSTIIVDAKSGISGAGKKAETLYLFSEANENMQAYALKGHRHQPEIMQEWKAVAPKASFDFIFTPQLAPLTRGIFASLYAPLKKRMTLEALHALYAAYYQHEPFVQVLPAGKSPELKGVAFTNQCHLGVSLDSTGKVAIIFGVLDNLVKGASGQAIQNMNIMFNLDERTSLM